MQINNLWFPQIYLSVGYRQQQHPTSLSDLFKKFFITDFLELEKEDCSKDIFFRLKVVAKKPKKPIAEKMPWKSVTIFSNDCHKQFTGNKI